MGGMTLKESQHCFFGCELIELTDKKCHSDRARGHLLSHWQAAQRENRKFVLVFCFSTLFANDT